MAFKTSELRAVNQLGGGTGLWTYQGPSTDTVTSTGYFNAASASLEVGDRILVTLFTDFDKTSEAYSSSTELVVTAVSNAGVVTVAEVE